MKICPKCTYVAHVTGPCELGWHCAPQPSMWHNLVRNTARVLHTRACTPIRSVGNLMALAICPIRLPYAIRAPIRTRGTEGECYSDYLAMVVALQKKAGCPGLWMPCKGWLMAALHQKMWLELCRCVIMSWHAVELEVSGTTRVMWPMTQ